MPNCFKSLQEIKENNIKIIKDCCLKLSNKIEAIILYGSYGREEGGWFKDKEGNWHPYNDYDIIIVTTKKIPTGELKKMEKSLANKIGVRWVDLGQFYPNELKKLNPSIFNYDLKYASNVIYGKNSILNKIPDINRQDLTLKEAKILFFTRLYTLIGSLDEDGLKSTLKGESSRFFRNQMAKAILAVVDILLLQKAQYHSSYRKRVQLLHDLYQEKQEVLELSSWALNEKLHPKALEMDKIDVLDLYKSVHEIYLKEMFIVLQKYFNYEINGPKDIEFCLRWLPLNMMKRIYWVLKFKGFYMENKINLMLAQTYIVAAWSPSAINSFYLKRANYLLKRLNENIPNDLNWDQARIVTADLRIKKD